MARRKHWVNDKAEFDWEIVLNGRVVQVIPKDFEDGDMSRPTNREKAVRRARALDRRLALGIPKSAGPTQ